jgi:hypothetical protein
MNTMKISINGSCKDRQGLQTNGTNTAEHIESVSTIQEASLKCCKSEAVTKI